MFERNIEAPLFASGESTDNSNPPPLKEPWKILIVDDEQGVHDVTELALKNIIFDDAGISFLHAYSGHEARQVLSENEDIAIVLLDVVMESDQAGLEVADFIRKELGNQRVRIVLRTGQPGQAPEENVVILYDINDYKEKTELTYRKLFSTVYTALRSYRDILALDRSRQGLERVIHASSAILDEDYVSNFAEGVLQQLSALLFRNDQIVLAEMHGAIAEKDRDYVRVLAYTGIDDPNHPAIRSRVHQALMLKQDVSDSTHCIRYMPDEKGRETAIYLSGEMPTNELDQNLLNIFCRNVSIALKNLRLNDSLKQTQKDIVYSLCELAETRSKETGNHVRRVAHYSRFMATEIGLNQDQIEEVYLASPLHDIGKIGIPDAVLTKPGKLDAKEWEIMKTHTDIGADIMFKSKQPIMDAGAIIAQQHHENWDGSGYPNGLAGEDIHIYGRIVALADVFDALCSRRCYKNAWAPKDVDNLIMQESGKKFDPALVQIYLDKKEEFYNIFDRYSDENLQQNAAD